MAIDVFWQMGLNTETRMWHVELGDDIWAITPVEMAKAIQAIRAVTIPPGKRGKVAIRLGDRKIEFDNVDNETLVVIQEQFFDCERQYAVWVTKQAHDGNNRIKGKP